LLTSSGVHWLTTSQQRFSWFICEFDVFLGRNNGVIKAVYNRQNVSES